MGTPDRNDYFLLSSDVGFVTVFFPKVVLISLMKLLFLCILRGIIEVKEV